MLQEIICPGLPAKWINAWLAAVGTTFLDARIRLHWTADSEPTAVLTTDITHPVDALVESWPDKAVLDDLPIAQHWRNIEQMKRNVPAEVFRQRAQMARSHPHSWTLSSTMTDLCIDRTGKIEHAPFDPPVPRGITLHGRLISLQEDLDISETRVQESLMGYATRVKKNGLGFDQTRLGSSSDAAAIWTDPVLETLVFFGLSMFPVRGNGIDQQLDRRKTKTGKRQRGWRKNTSNQKDLQFYWPAWSQPLDHNAIDALMDIWDPKDKPSWDLLGIHEGWRSVQFERRGDNDTTRAFGSERL